MLRIGSAVLLLFGLWAAPLTADEPPVDVDVEAAVDLEIHTLELQVDSDLVVDKEPPVDGSEVCVDLIDPMADDLMILTFSSEPIESGEVCVGDDCVEEHPMHECVDFIDGHCADPDCFWMRTRTLETDFVADGDGSEVLMFMSGVADNDMSIQTFGGAPIVEISTVNTAAFDASLGLAREIAPQPSIVVGLDTTATVQTGSAHLDIAPMTEASLVSDADRDYASRLASIDELRDRALETGDAALLQRADRMEAELKASTRTSFRLFGN